MMPPVVLSLKNSQNLDLLPYFINYLKSLGFNEITDHLKKTKSTKILYLDCRQGFFFANFEFIKDNFFENVFINKFSSKNIRKLYHVDNNYQATPIDSELDGYEYTRCLHGSKEFIYKNKDLTYIPLKNTSIALGGPTLSQKQEINIAKKFISQKKGCLFLDRDGVLIKDTIYPHKIKDFCIRPQIIPLLKKAQQENKYLVIVTNQSGLARGIFTKKDYNNFTKHLVEEFEKHQISFDKIIYCPYLKNADIEKFSKKSQLRKPSPGMILKSMEDIPINLSKSAMIGDKKSDILNLVNIKTTII
jgi:D-glycero-D-manno-heptose 1,7-bisphosphate phosphatase